MLQQPIHILLENLVEESQFLLLRCVRNCRWSLWMEKSDLSPNRDKIYQTNKVATPKSALGKTGWSRTNAERDGNTAGYRVVEELMIVPSGAREMERWLYKTLCRLPKTKRFHTGKWLPVAQNGRYLRYPVRIDLILQFELEKQVLSNEETYTGRREKRI